MQQQQADPRDETTRLALRPPLVLLLCSSCSGLCFVSLGLGELQLQQLQLCPLYQSCALTSMSLPRRHLAHLPDKCRQQVLLQQSGRSPQTPTRLFFRATGSRIALYATWNGAAARLLPFWVSSMEMRIERVRTAWHKEISS